MAARADQALGHCTNCHAEFDSNGNQLCPPCARAYVMGLRAGGGGDMYASYRSGIDKGWRNGFEKGWESGQDRLRELFLFREEFGLNTFADVVQALWPEED